MEQTNIIPRHIAIIPDGNRRWARAQGMQPWKGHDAGAKNIELIVRRALKLGVRCISFWGSSMDNLTKRPIQEKRELLRVYEEYFKKLITSDDIHENKVRINVFGHWEEQFPNSLKNIIKEGIEKTKNYKEYFLNFFLAYNGDDEMIEAIKRIVKKGISPDQITGEIIKDNLMTKDLPEVDFLIRTAGEPHLSAGFMMWDIANAQLYFSDKMFPDFNDEEFESAVNDFKNRNRRFGK